MGVLLFIGLILGVPATIWFRFPNDILDEADVEGVTLAKLLNDIVLEPEPGRCGVASERIILTPEFFTKSFKLLRLIYISTEINLIRVVEFF